MALPITTKLLFGFYICHLFMSMYIPLFKFIIPIGGSRASTSTAYDLQSRFHFNCLRPARFHSLRPCRSSSTGLAMGELRIYRAVLQRALETYTNAYTLI